MSSRPAVGFLTAALVLSSGACARDLDPLGPASFPSNPAIFVDGFGDGIGFAAFGGSKADAVQIDQVVRYTGDAALEVTVPDFGDPTGSYAGGAFVANVPRNLTGYDALTFWARASRPLTLDVAGLGNDNSGTSMFTAETGGLAVTTTWTKFVVPIPDPDRLDREAGLFYFAEGPENGQGALLWFDEVKFEQVGGLGAPRPAIDAQTVRAEVGTTAQVTGTRATFSVDGRDVTMSAMPSYFSFASSDESVAVVSETGFISVVGPGIATVTASLGGVQAEGAVVVRTALPPSSPAPTPTQDAADVISLFSDAYDDVPVDTWSAVWDAADVEDIQIGGDAVKKYSNLTFAGIELVSAPVDISAMTHFRMDFYTSDETAGSTFRIKLVDFGPDGVFGGDDTEFEVSLTDASSPAIATDRWVSLDIPLSAFTGLTSRNAFAQLIISGDPNTVYVDNVFFYKPNTPTAPQAPAPAPTLPQANVISVFSDVYQNVAVDRWSTDWDNTQFEDVTVQGDAVKKYFDHVFAGIEMVSAPIDATGMTHLHFDLWTPTESTNGEFVFTVVDFGANGVFDGGDDVQDVVRLTPTSTPALVPGQWISVDIPLSQLPALTTRGAIAQFVTAGGLGTFFLDNIYFHN